MIADIDLDAEVSRLKKRFWMQETIGFLSGLGVFTLVALFSALLFPHIETWSIVVWFMPIATLIAICALISSVSMQAGLRERGNPPHPIECPAACIAFLLQRKDEEGLRQLGIIRTAASVYLAAFGMAIGLAIFATVAL